MGSVRHLSEVIWDELGSPDTPTLIAISGWTEHNIGLLNISIDESYISMSGDFAPALDADASGIYKGIYMVKYFESRIKDSVNNVAVKGTGAALDWVEIRDGDSVVRRASPAEMTRIYRGLKSDAQKELNTLIHLFKANEGKPHQITGDEWLPL